MRIARCVVAMVLTAGVVLLLLGGFVLWKKGLGPPAPSATAPPRDPRLDYAGPFQRRRAISTRSHGAFSY